MAAVNSVGDFIKSVFPSIVNKNGKVFKALLTDGEGGGAIETVFRDLELTRRAWAKDGSVYSQDGETLEKTFNLISVLERLPEETERSWKRKNKVLFYRGGRTVWGTTHDILGIFKELFDTPYVFLLNNTEPLSESLLPDGNFEAKDKWSLKDCVYDKEARLAESAGVLFEAGKNGECSQSVTLEKKGVYFLHFFLRGDLSLEIKDGSRRYWHANDADIGEWKSEARTYAFSSSNQWSNKDIFFKTFNDNERVTITFSRAGSAQAFLDLVSLNRKSKSSTFSIIAVFEGAYSYDTASWAPGAQDTAQGVVTKSGAVKKVDYEKLSYLDKDFIFGSNRQDADEVFNRILDIVKPAGVFANLEILSREIES